MLRFCPNLHFLYREHPFLDRFAAAARDGFAAVEMTFPYDHPAAAVREAARRANVAVVEFNAPAGEIVTGVQRGFAAVPGRSREYIEQIRQGIDYAIALDCRLLLSLAGVLRPDASRAAARAAFVANLSDAADLCAEAGITLLIETNNLRDNPNYFLRTLDEVRDIIGAVGHPALKAVFDFYHVELNEGDAIGRFHANLDLIAHVQFADPPGRNEPGAGTLDFAEVFRAIEESGYAGWVGAEYFPSDDVSSRSLRWFREMAKDHI